MLEDELKKIRKAMPDDRPWGWDKRYQTALLVTRPAGADEVRRLVGEVVDTSWSPGNLGSAPPEVKALVDHLKDLRPSQYLYTKTIDNGLVVYAAFWPWVGASHVSVRVGVFHAEDSQLEPASSIATLKAVFTTVSQK